MSSKFNLGALFGGDLVAKAELFEQKGQLPKAAELFLKAKLPERAARLFVELGEVDRAVDIYREAGLATSAADLLQAEGRSREAIAVFEAAGELVHAAETCLEAESPQFVRAGRLFEQAGLYHRAVECFTQAGEIEHALGALELESNHLKKSGVLRDGEELSAEERVEKVRKIDLHRSELLLKLDHQADAGRLLAELGFHERAAGLLEADRCFAEAAQAYLDAGQAEAALRALERARDADDATCRAIHLGAAELFLEARRWNEAGRSFAEAGEHVRAGEAFAECRQHRDAAAAFQAVGELVRAGEQYLDAGDLDAARKTLEEVAPESPEIVPASLLLVSALLKSGEPEAARERLSLLEEGGVAGGVPSEERYYWEGRINEELANYSEAEDCYEKVVATHSDFRDTTERLREVRGKLPMLDTTGWQPAADRDDNPHKTGPIQLNLGGEAPGENAGGNTGEGAVSGASQGGERSPSQTFAALPYAIEQKLEPWWPGIQVAQATELSSQKAVLLVSLAQGEPGPWISSFRRIARDLTSLEAPAILKLDGVITMEGSVFLCYEPFRGEALASWLLHERPSPLRALYLLTQVCEALVAAHKLGISHRWLSPRTLLIDARNRVKVVGFGLREMLGEADPTAEAYLSPEAREGGSVGPAADVYSVGWLGVELLGAMMPVDREAPDEIDPARVVWPDGVTEVAPPPVREVLLRSLARSPLRRPSAEELRSVLSSLGMVPGQVIADRYEILGELGRGGMSRVYRARDQLLASEVAIKTLLTPVGSQMEDKTRLLREAQICLRITHPNVVRVYDAKEFPNGIFLIMELLDGLGLDDIIRFEAPLPLPRVRKLLAEVTAALTEAHAHNVVHRDLKPANIIVLANGRAKVMDFGIARSHDQSSSLTRVGEVIGSPLYMAPEQIQGLPLDGTCDLYALGVIAYAMLAGQEPFYGENANVVVLKHLNEAPPDIRDFNPELPQPWVDLLGKLLAKKPKDRYPDAEVLAEVISKLPE